jgi:outer membrane protein OmpA-like peptidoglycan-associated protein
MRALFLTAAALALAGCAHSSSVVLLPDEDGGHGALAISKDGDPAGETVFDEANARASLGKSKPSIKPLGAKGLKPGEADLISSLPPAAKSFSLYFNEGTTEMTPTSAALLEDIRAEVARRPGADVQVTGHTDTVGSESDNDLLSRKRADEVLAFLESKGFDRHMMRAAGRGERELKVPTDDNVSSPINRRVEVIVR